MSRLNPVLMTCCSCGITTIAASELDPATHDIVATCPACGAEPTSGLCWCPSCVGDGLQALPLWRMRLVPLPGRTMDPYSAIGEA